MRYDVPGTAGAVYIPGIIRIMSRYTSTADLYILLFVPVIVRIHRRAPVAPVVYLSPFRSAVPFWGQSIQLLSSLSPKRDCGTERVSVAVSLECYEP